MLINPPGELVYYKILCLGVGDDTSNCVVMVQ